MIYNKENRTGDSLTGKDQENYQDWLRKKRFPVRKLKATWTSTVHVDLDENLLTEEVLKAFDKELIELIKNHDIE